MIAEVEFILNSRPLTHVSVNPEDPEPLTPFYFLLGRPSPALPPDVLCEKDVASKKKWRRAQLIVEHFWKRWRREYLPNLQARSKWTTRTANLREDDVVLIRENNAPRGHWPRGRILQTIPEKVCVVRAARVKSKGTVYVRPVVKLILLERTTAEQDESIHEANGNGDNADRDPISDQQACH